MADLGIEFAKRSARNATRPNVIPLIPEFCGLRPDRVSVAQGLYNAIAYVHGSGVDGDMAEFGTGSGWSSRIIAAAMADLQCERTLHLFDSFKGFPKASHQIDLSAPSVIEGDWGEGRMWCSMSPERLASIVGPFIPDSYAIHEGWFSDTIGDIKTPLALLHLDCDLYQSTMDVLTPLFSDGLITHGATLLFDDYDCNHASCSLGQRAAWQQCVLEFQITSECVGSYGPFQRRFLIHDYCHD